jgi:hypothetical protein
MNEKILVAYASKYGATKEIAEKIGQVLKEAGHTGSLSGRAIILSLGGKMNMKKIKFAIFVLFGILIGAANLPAALTFSPPSPKTGETVTFTLSPSSAPVGAISWNFGDGTPVQTSTNLTMPHVYAMAGSYTASASYFTGLNAAIPQVDRVMVTVSDPRQITYSPLQPKAGQAVAFTALNFYSACIRWDFGDATIINGTAAESHTYAAAGSYTVHAYEECGATYGAAVTLTVAAKDEEPSPITPNKPTLAVTFISLYFAGGKADVSVAKDFAGLQAFADIQVEGTGILQWQWLVDGMTIKTDSMAAGLAGKFTLDSGKVPGLPTAVPGRHQVTLRFQNPKTDFAIPVITYFVGLRGPAPVVSRVTPATLAPGAEYNLELEGAELTSGTEISFPAPLALLKKAIILSPTQARATVFVPPTAGNGAKAVTARNEYGQSSGPGQVTITSPEQVLSSKPPDVKPYPAPKPPVIGQAQNEAGKKAFYNTPFIAGSLDFYPYAASPYASINIRLSKGGKPVSGAIIKIDGIVIPETSYEAGYYWFDPPMTVASGHVFKVSLTIDGVTYKGSGGKVDTLVKLTLPPSGSTIYFKKYSQFDCQWTFSNGPAQVHLYALYWGQPSIESVFEQSLTADHVSVPTAAIPSAQGKLWLLLSKQYSNILFDGILVPTSSIQVSQNYSYPQSIVDLSDALLEKTPLQKMTGTTPSQTMAEHPPESTIQTLLKTTPQLNGSITYYPNFDPDSPLTAYATYFFSKEGIMISDAIIKVDGILVPPNVDMYPPVYYGCYGSFKSRVPWPISIAVGHVTTISLTTNGTTYTGSGGLIDSIPQLIVPAEGTVISLKEMPYLNLQWTGAGGIVPVLLSVVFVGGGECISLCDSQVYTDHMQVHLIQAHNSIPLGAIGVLIVSLLKKYDNVIMDGMMRFTSAPWVSLYKCFYFQLIP